MTSALWQVFLVILGFALRASWDFFCNRRKVTAAHEKTKSALISTVEAVLARNNQYPPLHLWAENKDSILNACEAYRAGLEGEKQQQLDLVLREFKVLVGHNLAWNMSDANNAFTPGTGSGVPVEAGYVTGRALLAQALGRILKFARAG